MPTSFRSRLAFVPSLPFILLVLFMGALFVAGGSSRADVSGQVVVRIAATIVMVAAILFGPRPAFAETRPIWIILAACIALPAFQLIPLPPAVWQILPGRETFAQVATLIGQSQPWRPISLVPGATFNALESLLIPLATVLLLSQLNEDDRRRVPGVVLSLIVMSMFIGLMQFSGLSISAPFGDHGPVDVSGFFDNRNHFALLMAIGCALTPAWAFASRRQRHWRLPVAVGLPLLFALLILASGSRAGMAVGVLGLVFGIAIARRSVIQILARYPRWVVPATLVGLAVVIITVVSLSVATNRAISVDRILKIDASQDMRTQAFPTILKMLHSYFPVGTGYGSFETIYRIHEPFAFLSPNYFNHAHNDLMEVVLDGGVAGLALLAIAIFWWSARSFQAWRRDLEDRQSMTRVGSSVILLTILAGAVDYAARTPIMMAVLTVAAFWLCKASAAHGPALPPSGRPL